MAEWVLVLALSVGPSPSIASVTFGSGEACRSAGENITREWQSMRPRWICLRK